jgi:hypothetical protein
MMAVINKHIDKKDEGPTLDIYQEFEETALKLLQGTVISFRDKANLIKSKL